MKLGQGEGSKVDNRYATTKESWARGRRFYWSIISASASTAACSSSGSLANSVRPMMPGCLFGQCRRQRHLRIGRCQMHAILLTIVCRSCVLNG